MKTPWTHATRLAPGCHGEPNWLGPVVSRHKSYEAAAKKARRNDRLAVVEVDETGEAGLEVLFLVDPQGHPRLGAGRYGRGAQRG